MELRASDLYMKPQLRELYKICFNDSNQATDLFFDMCFKEENCLVCLEDRRVVSALYLFDVSINKGGVCMPAYYLYAVGTMPFYRGKGYMKGLFSYADDVAKTRGKWFCLLLPSSQGLYSFYQKLGYRKYFKQEEISITKENFRYFFYNNLQYQNCELELSQMFDIRKKFYKEDGDVVWGERYLRYATHLYSIYNGKTIFSSNGYAICMGNRYKVRVIDFAASIDDIGNLFYNIKKEYDSDEYFFRTSARNGIFRKRGKVQERGMIKSLMGEDIKDLISNKYPFLGLYLD